VLVVTSLLVRRRVYVWLGVGVDPAALLGVDLFASVVCRVLVNVVVSMVAFMLVVTHIGQDVPVWLNVRLIVGRVRVMNHFGLYSMIVGVLRVVVIRVMHIRDRLRCVLEHGVVVGGEVGVDFR
jgi:hypothetical protein